MVTWSTSSHPGGLANSADEGKASRFRLAIQAEVRALGAIESIQQIDNVVSHCYYPSRLTNSRRLRVRFREVARDTSAVERGAYENKTLLAPAALPAPSDRLD